MMMIIVITTTTTTIVHNLDHKTHRLPFGTGQCFCTDPFMCSWRGVFDGARVGNHMLAGGGGNNQTIQEHYLLVQYVHDVALAVLRLLTCACHQHTLLMELTGCLGLDPRGFFVETEPGPASPLQVLEMC